MVTRIKVRSIVADPRGQVRQKWLQDLGFQVSSVELIDVYTIDKKLSPKGLSLITSMLSNPLTQKVGDIKYNFDWAIEVGFLPGVTDNIGATAKEGIEDLLKVKFKDAEGVYSSKLFLIRGKLAKKDLKYIADNLINPLIQSVQIKNIREFRKDKDMDIMVPKVSLGKTADEVMEVNLNISDAELEDIGKFGIKDTLGTRGPLALGLDYMKAIQTYFKKLDRNPTDIEVESIAQTWSEHCKHTIFADPIDDIKEGLFKTYIKGATEKIRKQKGSKDFCVSVFHDNSGAIQFDKDYLITHKVETHNSPSALDPFGGAVTGIVGVNRDTIGFGLGAKPVINTYGFCFADPKDQEPLFKDAGLSQKMLSPKRIMDGVIEGINVGGNCSGISTPQGFLYFDKSYKGKPLVFAGTVGLIPKHVAGKLSHLKSAKNGDYIVMVGGRVGLDGIHGATFSSEALSKGSPATSVQIGDPITQKKLSDAIVKEARDKHFYNSITDNGAGGLSSSVSEMAKESGGAYVELDKVPVKYPGLKPWQIWISESQERMTLSIPKLKWKKFASLMEKRGVEATIIGKFNNRGRCTIVYNKKVIMDLSLDFLHNGLPKRQLKTLAADTAFKEPILKSPEDYTKEFLSVLSRLNIASFEFVSSQYDHEVQAGSVLKPLQGKGRVNGDTTITRPILASKKGVVLSQALFPTYGKIDTYHMAACSIDTAIRNSVVAGADPDYIALLDNFCWCSSNEPKRLHQLKEATKACFDFATAYKTPFISGKDSMFNDFVGFDDKGQVKISVLPTLLISAISVMEDVEKSVSLDAKFPGDLIYILGETFDELGGSEYFEYLSGKNKKEYLGQKVPKVNAKLNLLLYKSYFKAAQEDLIASGISIQRGGLAVALAKKAFGGQLGVSLTLKNLPGKTSGDTNALFSESQGRILLTIDPQNKSKFEKFFKGLPYAQIGVVTGDKKITIKGKRNIILDLKKVSKSYKGKT